MTAVTTLPREGNGVAFAKTPLKQLQSVSSGFSSQNLLIPKQGVVVSKRYFSVDNITQETFSSETVRWISGVNTGNCTFSVLQRLGGLQRGEAERDIREEAETWYLPIKQIISRGLSHTCCDFISNGKPTTEITASETLTQTSGRHRKR